MVLRDGAAGLEVLMLRRNLTSNFNAGAYVFPGGAIDAADGSVDVSAVCDDRTDEEASELLGIDRGGLAYWVAAIRECFEEAGVLLAFHEHSEARSPLSFADEEVARRFRAHRAAVYAGKLAMVDLCRQESLRLDTRRIHYFSHWITPEWSPRRFDTRFFVATAPTEQVPLHDDSETIASLWIRPADALARSQGGEFELILPTRKSLQAVARFDRAADVIEAAAAIERRPPVPPRVVADGTGLRIVLPGDPGYVAEDDTEAADMTPPDGVSFRKPPSTGPEYVGRGG
jgi:8-oxo-dGTP pyrophosphatase MutT (NUDIX family)